MPKKIDTAVTIAKNLVIENQLRFSSRRHKILSPSTTDVVICMKSYPARIKYAWLSLETLFRQNFEGAKIVLVLAESQFPQKQVPKSILRLVNKGLELLWVEKDGRSFDHLWPAYIRFPNCKIISVDDDKFFPPTLVSELVNQSILRPNTIIGARGWEIAPIGNEIGFGQGWRRASLSTPSKKLFMPPGNGSLYPPDSLPPSTGDDSLRNQICPNADDVWYWAMARLHGTPSICLGLRPHRPSWRQSRTPALADSGPGTKEFKSVVDYFDLRPTLLEDMTSP